MESGNGTGEPVTTFFGSTFQHCLREMPADRLSTAAKGPVPQPPQEHPSECSSGSDVEQACTEKPWIL